MKRTIFTRSFQILGIVIALTLCSSLVQQVVWAQPNCTGGNSPVTFFTEDFETTPLFALPTGWTESPALAAGWRVQNNTGSTGTGCDNEKSGTQRLDFETSGVGNGVTHDVFFPLDLTGGPFLNPPYELSFWFYMFGGNVGTLDVSVAPAGTTNFTSVFSVSGQQHSTANCTANDWTEATADLTSFAGQMVDVRIRGVNGTQGTSFQGDILIDLMTVTGCGVPCTITCPADITVDNSPGLCGANVNVPDPIISGPCQGVPINIQNIQGPMTAYNFGPALLNTPTTVSGAIPAPAGPVQVTADFNGDHDIAGLENFRLEGPDGSLIIDVNAGQCQNGSATVDVPVSTYNGWITTFGSNLTFLLRANTATNNGLGGCTNSYQVTISFATGSAPFSNNFNGGQNASGFYPVGTTEVTYTTTNEFGDPVSCTFNVTVNDTEAPVFQNCPNDIVINLDPGACDAIVTYGPLEVTDNCPPANFQLTQSNDNTTVNNSLACGAGASSYLRRFDLTALGITSDFKLSQADYGVWNGAFTATTRIFRMIDPNGPVAYSNFELLHTQDDAVPGGFQFMHSQSYPDVVIPGGSVLWFDVRPSLPGFRLGVNSGGETAPSYISSDICTFGGPPFVDPVTFASGGFGFIHWPLVLTGFTEIGILQTDGTGLTSGDAFPIGCTQQTYIAEDNQGNTSECSFEICVEEYPFPKQSLACNDLVNISLEGENCDEIVGADDILEGGPYGCYETRYHVELFFDEDLTQPVNNNPENNLLNASNLGQTLWAKVVDDSSGNTCWGKIFVEDKIPPVINCGDIVVPCDFDIDDFTIGDIIPAGPIMTLNTINAGGNAGAVGGQVFFDVTNLGANDLNVVELGMNISAATDVNIFMIAGTYVGNENNMAAWTQVGVADANTGPFSGPFPGNGTITPAPTAFTIPPGSWGIALITPTAQNNYTNGVMNFTDGTLEINTGAAKNAPWVGFTFSPRSWNGYISYQVSDVINGDASDGCDDNLDITFQNVDTEEFGCVGPFAKVVTRIYTATDDYGNTATCQQIISFERTDISDITFPPNWDGLDTISLKCDEKELPPPADFAPFQNGYGLCPPDNIGWNALDNWYPHPYPEYYSQDDYFPPLSPVCTTVVKWFGTGVPTGFCDNINCTYKDLEIPICEGSYKLLRTWTCIDWCTGEIVEHNQVIKVEDDEGPVADIPAEFTLNAISDCKIAFPHNIVWNVADNCSDSQFEFYIEIDGDLKKYPDEFYPPNAPYFGPGPIYFDVGDHNIVWIVKDACGIASEYPQVLHVEDFAPPVPICDEQTSVSLGLDGYVELCWETVDDGSYDNCEIVDYKLKRMDDPPFIPFTDCVLFDCWDVEVDSVRVRMRVYDQVNPFGTFPENDPLARFNECWVEVEVDDKLPPMITCPPNKNLDCWEFDPNSFDGVSPDPTVPPSPPVYFQGQLIGYYPLATDNCEVERVDITRIGQPDNCGVGTITHIWTARDKGGLTTSCVQLITITNTDPFWICDTECRTFPVNSFLCGQQYDCVQNAFNTGADYEPCCQYAHCLEDGVEWPCDIELNDCGPGLEPDSLMMNTAINPITGQPVSMDAKPEIIEDFCDLIGVDYKDTYLPITDPGCIKVLRKWIVLDWCQPDP